MIAPLLSTLLGLALVAPPPAGQADVVLDAMKDELARTKDLKLDDTPAPYWASYHVVDVEGLAITAKFGALYDTTTTRNRAIAPRVRVGDLQLDAVGVPIFEEPVVGYEDDYEALRHALWRFTDGAYKSAATQFRAELTEKQLTTADPEKPAAFTAADPIVSITAAPTLDIDREALENLARRVSAVFREHEHILDCEVKITAAARQRRFASTDGSIVVDGDAMLAITIEAQAQAEDGDLIERRIVRLVRPGELPDTATLEADAAKITGDLVALRKAPMIRDYSGPVLLSAGAAAKVFAGTLGPQLVGSGHWSGEVNGKMGQLVLPKNIDVVDDPLIDTFGGHALQGRMKVDDEGVAAERVELVRGGKLVGLLASRVPGKKVKRSNGHARSAPFGMDVSPGTTNLIVTAKGGLTDAALDKKLVALVRQRGAEFGIALVDDGDFGGSPLAYRVGKDGKRELVRVGFMGMLELRQLRDIAAFGKVLAVSHGIQLGGHPMSPGHAPVELAGFITPISVVAPAVLLPDIELHSYSGSNPKPPAYPRPALRKR
jgi:hypothetical protein